MLKKLGAISGIVMMLLSGCAGLSDVEQRSRLQAIGPNPELSPQDVVRIQMIALEYNNESNSGIEIAYRFASPKNKASVGSLRRYARMLYTEAYRPLLNPKETLYDAAEVSNDRASVRVYLTSESNYQIVYRFFLSNQDSGSCKGCWLTDGVQVESVQETVDLIRI